MTFTDSALLDAEFKRLAGIDAPPVVAAPKAKKKPTPPRTPKPEGLLEWERQQREARDEERRRRQREENARIQDDPVSVMPPVMTVEDMLADCVWIASGSQVGRLSAPKTVLSFGEFCDLTACNTTEVSDPDSKAKPRQVPNAVMWKKDATRKTVHARTFHAGAGEICRDPDGELAINSWRPIERQETSADVQPFLEHVAYLFEDATEREVFLDWLAHIEQRPGVLPHYGWLHIADNTGTGRNWLASVLARVWRGYVAPNVDLPALLESQFNGMLAGRVLAMVDEVQEGGGENPFRHANRLNAIVNAEERAINPKFGRQHKEHNSCRWLVFSNYENALPMKGTDRRWRVVRHNAAPRSSETYTKLYALLGDAEFINAVGVYLRKRDISAFNPGERPPMNEAKRAALNASKSMTQQGAEQLIKRWPADVITNGDAAEVLGDGQDKGFTPAMRRALTEAGAVQYGDGRLVKVRGRSWRCWILRNAERWTDATPVEIATEAARAREYKDALAAMDVLADSASDAGSDERPF
ncbi:primase-helicase family protein [Ralstonia nicotianae]